MDRNAQRRHQQLEREVKMTEAEIGLLRLIDRYGIGFDVTSPRIGKDVKSAATSLLRSGHISGKRKDLTITDLGRAALTEETASTRSGSER